MERLHPVVHKGRESAELAVLSFITLALSACSFVLQGRLIEADALWVHGVMVVALLALPVWSVYRCGRPGLWTLAFALPGLALPAVVFIWFHHGFGPW
jgi:hypothetical protein